MTDHEMIMALSNMARAEVNEASHKRLVAITNRFFDLTDHTTPVAVWEPSRKFPGYLQCSCCHNCYIHPTWIEHGKWNYCSSCGAKMEVQS